MSWKTGGFVNIKETSRTLSHLKGKTKEKEVPGHWRRARETVNLTAVFGKVWNKLLSSQSFSI